MVVVAAALVVVVDADVVVGPVVDDDATVEDVTVDDVVDGATDVVVVAVVVAGALTGAIVVSGAGAVVTLSRTAPTAWVATNTDSPVIAIHEATRSKRRCMGPFSTTGGRRGLNVG